MAFTLIHLIRSDCYMQVARKNIDAAGLSHKVKVIIGPAVDTLATITGDGTFDFAFIDADKENNLNYFNHAKRLVRSNGVIIVDNIFRNGQLVDESNQDSRVEGVRSLLRALKEDTDVESTSIATVGEKGYDGYLYALRK